jgi:hypothetical protein
VLIDNPLGLTVTGCEPGATVEMTALVDVAGAIYNARATFIADDIGTVDTAMHPSRGGTYSGVDPFGLWWSGPPLRQSTTPPLTLATCHLRVEAGGQATEAVLERRWLGPGVTLAPVREPGVVGVFARPAGDGPFPAWSPSPARVVAWAQPNRGHPSWPPMGSRRWPLRISVRQVCRRH